MTATCSKRCENSAITPRFDPGELEARGSEWRLGLACQPTPSAPATGGALGADAGVRALATAAGPSRVPVLHIGDYAA